MEAITIQKNDQETIKVITEFLLSLKGQMFTVWFIKRTNGELRKMNCRTGVKKWVKGVGLNFHPKTKNLLGVHVQNEADKKEDGAYRFVNLETVLKIKALKNEFIIPTIDSERKEILSELAG